MALITDKTQIKLISKLSGTSTFNGSDLLLLQRGFKSYKFNYSDLVSALPDGSTLETSSNQLGVKDSSIDTQQLADNSVDFSKMQDIDASSTGKVIGRMSGNGNPTEVDVITNLGTASNSNIPTGLAVKDYVESNNNTNYILETPKSITTSTSIDFTGIPSWAKRVTVMFDTATHGTSNYIIQLGGSGNFENTGYVSLMTVTKSSISSVSTHTQHTGFLVGSGGFAWVHRGIIQFSLLSGNTWMASGNSSFTNSSHTYNSGQKTLADTLTQIRFTTVNGTDEFYRGTINISYEG